MGPSRAVYTPRRNRDAIGYPQALAHCAKVWYNLKDEFTEEDMEMRRRTVIASLLVLIMVLGASPRWVK